MANEKNLKPFTSNQDKEKAKKNGSKGGKKRAKNIEKRKTYAQMANAMLSAKIEDETLLEEMSAFGIDDYSVKAYTLLGLIKASGEGSHNAFDRLMALAGEDTDESGSELSNLIEGLKEDE